MATPKSLLITGATGKQGGAIIRALLSNPEPPFRIFAVTRNPASPSAQKLASNPSITLVQGDLDDCPAIFAQLPPSTQIWGVFSVQVPPFGPFADPTKEEVQGKALVDAALEHGVKHFVYSSVDRGGDKSDNDPTYVPHFITKYNIEKYLQEKADDKMSWTIFRPVAFFDNITNDFPGKMFASVWRGMSGHTSRGSRLQFVSTMDIGWFAAEAFRHPDEWRNRKFSLAGADITFEEGQRIFRDVVGRELPVTYGVLGGLVRWGVKEMGLMVKWFEEVGYGADVEECRRLNPEMRDFGKWLRDSKAFA
ncbi:MAG: hypothetical protein Q9187_004924 [Circinaria calcarea]